MSIQVEPQAEPQEADQPHVAEGFDGSELVTPRGAESMELADALQHLHEKDRHIAELEAELLGRAELADATPPPPTLSEEHQKEYYPKGWPTSE